MTQTAERMRTLQPYFFAELTQHVNQLRASGRDVIRLDIGVPDMPPAGFIVKTLTEAAGRADTHGYQAYRGTPELRAAWATMYERDFQVALDPASQIVPLLGSKEGIFHLTQAHANPGDVVLVPDPGYPSYARAAAYAGAEVVQMPLLAERGFLPQLDEIPAEVAARAKILWINYPNNPTAAIASGEFFSDVIAFGRKHNILIFHDAPYTHVTYDGYRAPSILEVEGASDVAVELNSLSKAYNMAGWRVGAAVGNAAALEALYVLKTNIDTSHFLPIMQAATVALTGDQEWLAERNDIYQHRRDILVETLQECGFSVQLPKATLYIWAGISGGAVAKVFARELLDDIGVSLAPGSAFGELGEGYVRVSVGIETSRVEDACKRMRQRFVNG